MPHDKKRFSREDASEKIIALKRIGTRVLGVSFCHEERQKNVLRLELKFSISEEGVAFEMPIRVVMPRR